MTLFIEKFEVILFDQGQTFMFDNDRFGDDVNYYSTYKALGGTVLEDGELRNIIDSLYDTMEKAYSNPAMNEKFPTVTRCLNDLPATAELTETECARIDELIGLHEVGIISDAHKAVIKSLAKTHRLGIVSNIWAGKKHFVRNLKKVGIFDDFENIVWSSDHNFIKPSHRLFEIALDHFETPMSQILYVGDDAGRDVGAAKSMGLSAAWVSEKRNSFPEEYIPPDIVIADISELIER